MPIKKLHILNPGYALLNDAALNADISFADAPLIVCQVMVYLLETSNGLVLIDSGFSESYLNKPDYYQSTPLEEILYPHMTEDDLLPNALKQIGYDIKDIDLLISTHLHGDHAGGGKYFEGKQVVIQQEELTVLNNEDYAPADCRLDFLNYQPISGDYQLTDDILLLSTPGHSPGHQSVLVNTEKSGQVLLTIDAVLTKDHFNGTRPPQAADINETLKSIEKLKAVAKEYSARVFFGHDKEHADKWERHPVFH